MIKSLYYTALLLLSFTILSVSGVAQSLSGIYVCDSLHVHPATESPRSYSPNYTSSISPTIFEVTDDLKQVIMIQRNRRMVFNITSRIEWKQENTTFIFTTQQVDIGTYVQFAVNFDLEDFSNNRIICSFPYIKGKSLFVYDLMWLVE